MEIKLTNEEKILVLENRLNKLNFENKRGEASTVKLNFENDKAMFYIRDNNVENSLVCYLSDEDLEKLTKTLNFRRKLKKEILSIENEEPANEPA